MKKQLSKEEKENIKRQYNINNDEKVIIYTGRLMPEKGVKELIQAYIELSKEKNDIVLLIAGGARQINKIRIILSIKSTNYQRKQRVELFLLGAYHISSYIKYIL